MSKSTYNGNTIVSSVVVPKDTDEQHILKLWGLQVALHSYHNFNLILDLGDGGIYYTSNASFDEITPYLKKYFEKGYINTGGSNIDKYIKKTFKKYITTDFPNRPAYLIYVKAHSRTNRGENKIFGIKQDGLDNIIEISRQYKAHLLMKQLGLA